MLRGNSGQGNPGVILQHQGGRGNGGADQQPEGATYPQNEPPNHSVTARFPLCSMSEEWKLYSAKNLLGYEHQQYAVPAVL